MLFGEESIVFKHPKENGMTYWQHLLFAIKNGTILVYAGLCCVIHGFIPCWFEATASSIIKKLYIKIVK
jgi:hypothetical protein